MCFVPYSFGIKSILVSSQSSTTVNGEKKRHNVNTRFNGPPISVNTRPSAGKFTDAKPHRHVSRPILTGARTRGFFETHYLDLCIENKRFINTSLVRRNRLSIYICIIYFNRNQNANRSTQLIHFAIRRRAFTLYRVTRTTQSGNETPVTPLFLSYCLQAGFIQTAARPGFRG